MVPFLLGLVVGLAVLLYAFLTRLLAFIKLVLMGSDEVIVEVLKLVNLSLIANLMLVIIWAGYERFVAPASSVRRPDWPEGLTGIGFSGTRQRILGTIVAIAAVNVLEWFMDVDRSVDNNKLGWLVAILITFSIVMLAVAIADRLGTSDNETG